MRSVWFFFRTAGGVDGAPFNYLEIDMRTVWLPITAALIVGCGKMDNQHSPNRDGVPVVELEAVFDSENSNKTVRWVAKEREASWKLIKPGNSMSAKAAEEQFLAALNSTVGKSIKWPLAIKEVQESMVIAQEVTLSVAPSQTDPIRKNYSFAVGTHTAERISSIGHFGGPLKPSGGRSRWLSASAGEEIVVTGVIGSWYVAEQGYAERGEPCRHIMVCARLKDAVVEKPG